MSEKTDIVLQSKTQMDTGIPSLWKVIFLNDDVTPMDLVIAILEEIFNHTTENAKRITQEIHELGQGVAGIYPHEVAEQLSIDATNFARGNNSPLRVQIEKDE